MTLKVSRIAAILVIAMTLVPAFAPYASVLGQTVTTFSDGSYSKVISIPPGGGDDLSAAISLPAMSIVKRLGMTLTPQPVIYNGSLDVPADVTFAQGTYDEDWLSADNDGLRFRTLSFKYDERFWDFSGIDNSSTTANVLIEEGLEGVALWPDNGTNQTYTGESAHGVDAIATFSFDGRLIKHLTLNATGTTQWGVIWATVRLWNNQTQQWVTVINNQDISNNPNHFLLVDADYLSPKYSKLEVRLTPTWAMGTRDMWFEYNITTQSFMQQSMVSSALIDPVKDEGWKAPWYIQNCSVESDMVIPSGTAINISLSADNGTNWENLTGTDILFSHMGNELRWRANLTTTMINTTPVLRSLSLICWRATPLVQYGYKSTEVSIHEGSFVSYSMRWYGTSPQGTEVAMNAQRDMSDPGTGAANGQIVDLEYNRSLPSLAFNLYLSGNSSVSPDVTKVVLNYTVEVRPSDVAFDVGDDGIIDWQMSGDMAAPVALQAPETAKMIAGLNLHIPSQGTEKVPLRVLSGSSGTVTISDLTVEYGLPPTLRASIPELNLSEDKAKEGALFLDAYFTDDYDSGLLSYSVPYMKDPSKVLAIVNGSRLDIELPTKDWFGSSVIRVRATDSDGAYLETNDILVNVAPVNDPPVIEYVPSDIVGYIGVDLRATIKATDVDGDVLKFSLDEKPSTARIDPLLGVLEWRPAMALAQAFRVNVSDGVDWVAKDFAITAVLDMTKASAPMFTSKPVVDSRVGTPYRYEAAAIDLDGDTMEFSLSAAPAGMAVNSTDGVVLWTPTIAQLGYQNVTLRVSDGGFSTDQKFRVLVVNSAMGNKLPIISSTPPVNAWVGQPYVYSVKASDPDVGTVLWYQLSQGPKEMSLDDGGRLVWVPTSNDIGDHSVQVVVTDGVAQVPQGWTLRVHASDRTCIISTPADYAVVKDDLVVTGLAFGPANLTRVEVRVGKENWRQASGLGQWSIDIDLKDKPTGYYYVKARACDSATCSKEASVRIYHQGKGGASTGLSNYWYAAIAVIIAILVLLVVDLKFKFIRPPDARASKVASDDDLESIEGPLPRGRGQYRDRDR